ncbi:MAG: flagellar motor switch protein FliG [Treponema sp.]|nr:flagellar motor switch protein FliG [Treponema sp.]
MNKNDLFMQAYKKQQNLGENEKKEKVIKAPSFPKINSAKDIIEPQIKSKIEEKSPAKEFYKSSQKAQAPSKSYQEDQINRALEAIKGGGLIKVPAQESPEGKESVYRRVAKFLLLIGEEQAAQILPHLNEDQIEKIIPEIASIRSVSKDEASVIMAEFSQLMEKTKTGGGVETAREMLEKAYGKERAEQMLKKAMPLTTAKPFEYFEKTENERIYNLIKDENQGVQCMVLSYIPPKKAAAVINMMSPEDKKEVVLRLAKMGPVSPEVLRRVDQAMHEKSLHQTTEKSEIIDGRNALAQILKKMDLSSENDILSYLSEDDPDLGKDLRNRLFTMEDVLNADDKFIQEKLHEMSEVDIAYLIADKNQDFREKILSNISAGRRSEVLDQEEILKPMRKRDVDFITQSFLGKLRTAFESGNIIIKGRNEEKFI